MAKHKRYLTETDIGYRGIGADGRLIERYDGWNPGAFGCSGGCDGCWSRESYARKVSKCEKCRNFEVHLHEERLCEPANTAKPRLVLKDFTNDWADRQRPWDDVCKGMDAMYYSPIHTYILLTQQAAEAASHVRAWLRHAPNGETALPANWYLGQTIRNRPDLDRASAAGFFDIDGKLWISYEPAAGELAKIFDDCPECRGRGWVEHLEHIEDRFPQQETCPECSGRGKYHHNIQGIIIGHDRRKGAPGTDTVSHIYSCIEQCKAAGVAWWVKQIWVTQCDNCGRVVEREILGERKAFCLHCAEGFFKRRLLHASKPDEYALFPEDLKGGRLPWSAPKEP